MGREFKSTDKEVYALVVVFLQRVFVIIKTLFFCLELPAVVFLFALSMYYFSLE